MPSDRERLAFRGVDPASLDPAPSQRVRADWLACIDMHSPDRRPVLAAVAPYVDRGVLAEQIEREEEQRRALSAFLGSWGASGKSSVAGGLRDRFGRGLALVAQDNLRRIVLRERDRPGAANIGLINLTARYAVDAGYHVVVEGILHADRYGDMLTQLRADRRGSTHAYYLHVPFEQILARHATKPIANDVGEPQLRDWYRPLDLLPGGIETVIGADNTLPETVDRIMLDTGLAGLPALER